MIKYRDHRGSYAESMKTVQEFETRRDMMAYIVKTSCIPLNNFKMCAKQHVYDDRNGWDTYIITINHSPIGFTDGYFEKESK